MKKRDVLNSPKILELKNKKRKTIWTKVLIFAVGLLVILGSLVAISRSPKLIINNVEVSGNKVISAETVQGLVQNKINGYYFWLIPKSNFLIYSRREIKKDLAQEFKIFKNIS